MVLTMLCFGVGMVVSLANYHVLVSIHRPLGIAILILVVVCLVNRLLNPPPPFPATMSHAERLAATASEFTMYGLSCVLPLVGWGMPSASRYPIVHYGPLNRPYILPRNAMLNALHQLFERGHDIPDESWPRLFNVNRMSRVRLSQGGAF